MNIIQRSLIFKKELSNLEALAHVMKEIPPLLTGKSILLFTGDLGAGKTTSVKLLMEFLGVKNQNVASPSFALHHQYKTAAGLQIEHFDLYRLEDQDDLESTGFWDVFATEEPTVVVIEWADRLNWDYLPADWNKLHLEFEISESSTGAENSTNIPHRSLSLYRIE